MKRPKRDPVREDRIHNEAIVDASPDEQAMSWYYYLESKISFPFQAKCLATKVVSPLRKGETVEVVRMAPDEVCEHDMLVLVRWQGRTMAAPLSQLTAVDPDESTAEAIGDWHYWVAQGYCSEFCGPHHPAPSVESNRHMIQRQSKSQPTWTDVKAKLASFDRAGLLGLIQDLYAAHKDNQTFLHTRFGLGEDVLEPYKETMDRWLWPDALRNQDTSVVKAKQAISNYKKAVGDPAGLAELMVFYCEQASGFAATSGIKMKATSMHWCACSNRLWRPRTHCRPTLATH